MPQKKRTTRRRSPKKRRKTKRARFPWIRILIALLVVIAGYVAFLDFQVYRQFEGKRWSLPARVYARPLELYAGLHLTADQFATGEAASDLVYDVAIGPDGSVWVVTSNSIANCAEVIATLPLTGDGQTNRPRSNRLENRHAPCPSNQMIFTRSPRRPRKTNRWPENGSCSKASWARILRPLKPFRMSVTPEAIQTFVLAGTGIIASI